MANFVATHGGDVFMRGYIYALGGLFRGAVSIANGKIQLNEDGSGSLANSGYSWDSYGVATKSYPERTRWVDFRSLVKNTATLPLDKGGYINNVNGMIDMGIFRDEIFIPTPPSDDFTMIFEGYPVVTRSVSPITFISENPFVATKYTNAGDDTYIEEVISGTHLYFNSLLPNTAMTISYNDGKWYVTTNCNVSNDAADKANNSITIWS